MAKRPCECQEKSQGARLVPSVGMIVLLKANTVTLLLGSYRSAWLLNRAVMLMATFLILALKPAGNGGSPNNVPNRG
jgi:hypothetical protein